VAILLAVPAHDARADETARARADQRARRGYDLAQAKQLDAAIAEFKQALAIDQRAIYLCNIGMAYSELGRVHRAHWFLDQCLERWSETEDSPIEPRITQYLNQAVKRLSSSDYGRLRIKVEPAAATISIPTVFAPDEGVRPRRIVWLPVGRHQMRITSAGFRPLALELEVVRGEQREIEVALEPVTAPLSAPAAEIDRPGASEPPGLTAPVTVLAIGGAALVAGGVSHAVALDRRSTAADLLPGPEFDAADSSYRRWRRAAIGLYVGGAVTAGLGTVWLLARRRQRARRPALSASAGADHGLITAAWRF